MKMFKVILILSCFMIIPSCSGDDSNKPSSNDTFFAKINGEEFNAEFATGFVTTFNTTLTISGSDGKGKEVTLNFPLTATAGSTYTVENLEFIAGYDASENDVSMAKSGGLVTITSHDADAKRVSGIFSFTTEPVAQGSGNSYVFTEGAFNVSYTEL
ncbi:hypothetical protein FUA26_02865 [Seonamhaeicola algicola]|uniref:Uncharacterized protein n=2 Tax=Seonamhaeicola algicola TaxID=1719036 RepID=A0A5C7AVF0_9FLAO|nr:hypothetical protein FUA26_02865 [Seonamhaeicola algicola]